MKQFSSNLCKSLNIIKLQGFYQPKMSIISRFTTGYKNEKEEKPFDFSSVVSGCGGITDYRTFMNDFRKCAEFVRWLKEKTEG